MLTSLSSVTVYAQNPLLRYADKQFGLANYPEAAEAYEQAFDRKEKYQTAKKVAQSYSIMRDYQKSNVWWSKVISFEEATRVDYQEFIVSSYQMSDGNLDLDSLLKDSAFSKIDFPEIQEEKLNDLYKNRTNLKLVPVEGVNSEGSDYGLSLDEGGNVYFSTDRGDVIPTEKAPIRLDLNNIYSEEKYDFNDRQFFRIIRKDSTGALTKLELDDLEVMHFSDPSFMYEKGLVFYTATRNITKAGKKRSIEVGTEIFYSKINENGILSSSKSLSFNDAISYSVMHPFVDEANKKIYFSSDMPGGYGGVDLYFVNYDDDLNFSEPVNLGSTINTSKNESHPYTIGDKLYFSSNGHFGLGGLDVFVVDFSQSNPQKVDNLGAPINSTRDDFAYSQGPNGKRFISSDRVGGAGMDDVYSIEYSSKTLLARVMDCDEVMIKEQFDVELRGSNQDNDITSERRNDGAVIASLSPDSNFELKISKKGYFSIFDNTLSTVNLEEDTLRKDYRLAKIPYQMPVYVDIVYYDLDSSAIRQDAATTLDKLGSLMQKYPFLDLLVGSHTDARASDDYNQELSQRRAKAVLEFLSKYNIEENRVRADWYGEDRLTNDCGDGVPCPETDHQLNRRSELILEAFPDPNKDYELPAEFLDKDICDEFGIFEELQKQLNEIPIVYFDFDKSTIRPVHKMELERTALMMNRIQNLSLYIAGHTDQRGSDEYNKPLSERRSKVVMDYLINRGVEESRMHFEWFGKTQPIHDCGVCNESQHQQNRRTELKLKR